MLTCLGYTFHVQLTAAVFREPGVEMSGEYTCKVSTLENEVTRSSTMVVYTPPRLAMDLR